MTEINLVYSSRDSKCKFKLMLFIFVCNKLVIVIAGFTLFLLRNTFLTKLRSEELKIYIFIPVSDNPSIRLRAFTSLKEVTEKRVAQQELTARKLSSSAYYICNFFS